MHHIVWTQLIYTWVRHVKTVLVCGVFLQEFTGIAYVSTGRDTDHFFHLKSWDYINICGYLLKVFNNEILQSWFHTTRMFVPYIGTMYEEHTQSLQWHPANPPQFVLSHYATHIKNQLDFQPTDITSTAY